MRVSWVKEDADFHTAECVLGIGHVMYLLVESLGKHGWDWQAWNPIDRRQTHYGVAETLEAAKVQAELALVRSTWRRARAV